MGRSDGVVTRFGDWAAMILAVSAPAAGLSSGSVFRSGGRAGVEVWL